MPRTISEIGAGRLVGEPHGDRVTVVGDDVEHREVEPARGVQRLPELALRGRAVAQRHVRELVAVRDATREIRAPADVARGLRAPDRRQALTPGARGLAHDVEVACTPVARHLTPAGGGVVGRADRLEQHLARRDPEGERERAVAVVGEEPVVAGPQVAGETEQQRLVARAGYLEERATLLAQRDLAVVEAARDERQLEVGDGFVKRAVVGALEHLHRAASRVAFA